MPGGFSKELYELYNTPFRKLYLSTKLKLLNMLNCSHSYCMSKAMSQDQKEKQHLDIVSLIK